MKKRARDIGKKNRRDTLIIIAIVVVLIPLVYFLVKWVDPGYTREPYTREEWVLDDYVTITAYGKDRGRVEEAVGAAFEEIFHVDSVANRYNSDSELALLNEKAANEPVAVSDDLWDMIAGGMEVYEASGGLFDITVGPLVDLWDVSGRYESGDPPPSEEEIESARERVGANMLSLEEARHTVFFSRDGMVVDLGGLAKGYALDRAAEAMSVDAVDAAVIDMISTSMTMGNKPEALGGPRWRIAIINPRGEGFMGELLVPGGSLISTSGDYQRYFEYGGKRYHHILDVRTGYPARGVISVTVIGSGVDGAWSDAISTAAFVMGVPEALDWLGAQQGLEAIIVDGDGVVHTTPGIGEWVLELKDNIDLGNG
ncbi:MAG: FAD:protein FMN transferase [Actinomycetota bacterium]|nr:FAD:protein FMN transferase [Actinomycetota bacterium]